MTAMETSKTITAIVTSKASISSMMSIHEWLMMRHSLYRVSHWVMDSVDWLMDIMGHMTDMGYWVVGVYIVDTWDVYGASDCVNRIAGYLNLV